MPDPSARLTGRTPCRTWLDVGAAHTETEERKTMVAAAIDALTWTDPPPDGPAIPVLAALAITTTVRVLGLPAMEAVAWDGDVDGRGLYGIQAPHAAADVRVYLLDAGTTAVPLATDVWGSGGRA